MARLNHDLNIKQEEEGDGIVKQVQPCTKVKKEEEGDGECKLEWDGDECDCLECRVDRTIKVEFNQNNATNNQQKDCPGTSDAKKGAPSQSSVCKRVKKEEDDDEQWDEDCDCDDCRRMRLKVIRLKQSNIAQNETACDDDYVDDETEIDDEEYEMDVDGEVSSDEEKTEVDEQLDKKPDDQLHRNAQSEGEFQMLCSLAIDPRDCSRDDSDDSMVILQTENVANNAIGEESIATECTTNSIQPNTARSNHYLQNIQNDEENDNNEKCVSERKMEQSTPSTSGVRSSTRKRIQTKVFGDLVQSNENSRKCAKRKSDQANESEEKMKRKKILNDDEDSDSDDNDYNSIGEEIATECTTNPIQANLTNRIVICNVHIVTNLLTARPLCRDISECTQVNVHFAVIIVTNDLTIEVI